MPRGKRLNQDDRLRIVEAHKNGAGTTELAREYGVSRWTVYRLVQRFEETGSVDLAFKRCGRKPKLTALQLLAVKEMLAENPKASLQDIHDALKLPCTLRALYYIVKKHGFERGTAPQEPKKENPLPVWKGWTHLWQRHR